MFTKEIYSARRAQLLSSLKARGLSGVALLLGNAEASRNYPHNQYAMRQDSTFLYYFGLNRHDLAATIDIDSGSITIYGDDYTVDDFIWMGPQPSISDQAASVGVQLSAEFSALSTTIKKASGRDIHYLPPYRAHNQLLLASLLGLSYQQIATGFSEEFIRSVVAQREIKSSEEIVQMDDASTIGNLMHCEAARICKEGLSEQVIAGTIEGISLQYGRGVSFHPIVSQHGETLHNHDHSGILTNGKLLLCDAGAENNMHYCSDFTRTLPVGGKFTDRQRSVYEIVHRALNVGVEHTVAGVINKDVQRAVAISMAEDLKALGLMKGDTIAGVESGAVAMFMPHGLGHQIGLDVHDMEDFGEKYVGYDEDVQRSMTPGFSSLRMGKRLRVGHCLTIEPGVYFVEALIEKWESEKRAVDFINYSEVKKYYGFGGIRLENSYVIEADGLRALGDAQPPIGISVVEDYMSR